MQRWRGLEPAPATGQWDEVPSSWGRSVVTIGVFDGVHRGHRELIDRAVAAAKRQHVPSVLMTFDPHPMEVVRAGSHPAQLTTVRRRAELVEELGIDVFCVIPFTPEFMKLTPERYVQQILVERLHVTEVIVGENFTYGRRAAGNVTSLTKAGHRLGFAVDAVKLVGEHAVTFSSTYIRACVDAGDLAAATEALGRHHRVEGVVVHGEGRGRGLGFPTANVSPPVHAAIPADGVYACWFTVLGNGGPVGTIERGQRAAAAVSIGTNPTFDGRTRTIEAFILDGDANLYGQPVAVDFVARIRDMEKFSSIEELQAAVDGDVARSREVLAADR